ncbi:hypothetical protein [Magnetospirillum aberrantis]|uniref:STAS domain-containing protein n=1 Tax=Magnetospirillum aberrantis SpK TaxID=908842 RepID=A0A7C9QVX2_9PROT|nr:hypothetical protein [Magnetospirillum aberrantis]NFV81737.1 hypothetical protein [Magnetospirillum aberrantis SpK]
MEIKDNNGRLEVELPGIVDLIAAGELRDLMLDALAKDSAADLILRGQAVDRICTAAIQVILAGVPAFRTAARRLEIEDATHMLEASFRQLGLGEDFDNFLVIA